MDVYQCPECDLKFPYPSELQQHLSLDHPDFNVTSKTIENAVMSASNRSRRGGNHDREKP